MAHRGTMWTAVMTFLVRVSDQPDEATAELCVWTVSNTLFQWRPPMMPQIVHASVSVVPRAATFTLRAVSGPGWAAVVARFPVVGRLFCDGLGVLFW